MYFYSIVIQFIVLSINSVSIEQIFTLFIYPHVRCIQVSIDAFFRNDFEAPRIIPVTLWLLECNLWRFGWRFPTEFFPYFLGYFDPIVLPIFEANPNGFLVPLPCVKCLINGNSEMLVEWFTPLAEGFIEVTLRCNIYKVEVRWQSFNRITIAYNHLRLWEVLPEHDWITGKTQVTPDIFLIVRILTYNDSGQRPLQERDMVLLDSDSKPHELRIVSTGR